MPEHGDGDGSAWGGEDRFRTVFAHAAVGMAVTDADGRFLEANPAYCRIVGYSEAELRRLDLASLTHPDDRPGNQGLIRRMLDGPEPGFVLEKRYLRKDGGVVRVKASVSLVRDGRGRPHRIVALIEDVTEARAAQDRLRESEGRARLLLDSAGEAIYGVDTRGRCTFCNPACLKVLGYDRPEDLLGRNMHDLIHHSRPDGSPYPEHECRIYRAFRRGEGTHADDEVFWRADGSAFPVEYRSHPVRGGDELVGSVVTFADITERRRAEATIAEQVRLAEYGRDVGRALAQGGTLEDVLARCAGATVRHLDGAFARIWTVNEAGDLLELRASAGMYTHTDGPHARIPVGEYKIGQIARDRQPHLTNSVVGDPRIPAQDWARAEGMVAFAGYPLVVEGRLVGVMALFARHELSGATLRAMASVADEVAVGIERDRAEGRLHRHREWLRVTLASIGDGVIATDTDGRVSFLNSVAEALTGWDQRAAVGRPLAEVFRILNERTRGEVENPALRALRDGQIVGLANHTVLIARDGTERAIDDSAAPIRDEDGAVMGAVLIFRDVDERRRAEHALERSEARKAAVLDAALDAIVTMDHAGRVVEWNPAAERTFGYPRGDALGREMGELIIPPPLRDAHRRGLAHYLATGEGPVLGRRIEITAVRADGAEFPVELAIARIAADGPPLFTAHVRDITERVRSERALREGEERFRTMAESIPQLAWMARPDGHIDWYNRRWYEYTGTTPEQMEGWGWQSVHDPEALPGVLKRWRASIASGEPFDMTFPLRGADGRFRPFLTRVMPVKGEDGRVVHWFGTNTDVSERVATEEAQREARFRLEALLAAGEVGTWEYDVPSDTVRADPNLARMFGLSPEEASRGPLEAYLRAIHPDDRGPVIEAIGRALEAGEVYEAEYRLVGHDGSVRWVVARGRVERDGQGRAVRLPGVVVDLTAQRRAEETLRHQHELTRAITDNATTAIFLIDERCRCAFMNPAAEAMTGYAFAEAEGRVLHDLIHHARPDGTPYPVAECPIDRPLPERSEVRDHEDVFVRRDGTSFPVLCNARPIRGVGGRAGTVIEVRDITERRRYEDELRHAKEEAEAANQAKTQFLAVLSHELRTPLNPILLAASSMLEQPGEPEELRPTLRMIRQNVLLQARLIDDLLDVMRIVRGKMPLHWEVADCHRLIAHAAQVFRSEVLGHNLRMEVHADARHHFVNADPARLQQVFWNLIRNAVKFTPEGGSVTIRTYNTADPGQPEGMIVVEVSDTGIGIEPQVLPVIFDPFQQGETTITRRFGGLGLGLAICKGIVDAHGGTIAAESAGKGRGTTFRVALKAMPDPTDDRDGRTDRDGGEVADAPPASLRILAVEDEPTTLRLMARLLRGLGHEVTTAGSVAEALRAIGGGEFDLIISDIGLPDGTGLDLMRRAAALRGPVAAIALTGYGMEEDIRRSREAGFTAHLTKPIDFAKLESMIKQVSG